MPERLPSLLPASPEVERAWAIPAPGPPAGHELLHALMGEVVAGRRLDAIAELTAEAVGAPVAIVVPELDAAVGSSGVDPRSLREVADGLRARLAGRPAEVGHEVRAEAPVVRAGTVIGGVLLLAGRRPLANPSAAAALDVAAAATLARIAVREAHARAPERLRGSLLSQLESARPDAIPGLLERARELGASLDDGLLAVTVRSASGRPWHVEALIGDGFPGALVERDGRRVRALLPAPEDGYDARVARIDARLREHGTVAVSHRCCRASEAPRALAEARLIDRVLGRSPALPLDPGDPAAYAYRLLLHSYVVDRREVAELHARTIVPLLRDDDPMLLRTLSVYVATNGNANAAAAQLFAHRHTIAGRLRRILELTGLDPASGAEREQLALGFKAHEMLGDELADAAGTPAPDQR